MNSVYVETASRIYAATVSKCNTATEARASAELSFDLAELFMDEYRKRHDAETAQIQQVMQQHPGAVLGTDPLEIRNRPPQ